MVHTNTSVLSVYVVHITVFIGLGLDWIGFGIDESTEILIYSLTCGRPKSTST